MICRPQLSVLQVLLLRHLSCLLTGVLACSSCTTPTREAPPNSPPSTDVGSILGNLKHAGPGSPAVLNAQLDYAQLLLSGDPTTCAERLEHAQEQLGSVDANARTRVMYPDGWAAVLNLEYRLHTARAGCGGGTDRKAELRIAVDAAHRGTELYRNAFDYHSMVIMQFDASVALHELGESAQAISALEEALKMDQEYGFADDASENYKLLLTWRGEPATKAQIAKLMEDFPRRRATLKFGWRASDADITLESRRACLVDGQVVSSRAAAAFERRIVEDNGNGWSVSYSNRLTQYDPGVWPVMHESQTPPMAFSPALLPEVGFKVKASGEFDVVTDSKVFAPRLAVETEGLIRAAAPAGDRARGMLDEAVQRMPAELSPGMLEAATAENYQVETAMWIGATLDQGVWYEMDAPLSLPGMPWVVAQTRMEFAFTRMVPCSADAVAPTCVELVIHTAPDQKAIDRVMSDYNGESDYDRIANYTASTNTRIVIDPATLLPFAREKRVYWYASLGAGNTILQSEHLLSTTRYGAD